MYVRTYLSHVVWHVHVGFSIHTLYQTDNVPSQMDILVDDSQVQRTTATNTGHYVCMYVSHNWCMY